MNTSSTTKDNASLDNTSVNKQLPSTPSCVCMDCIKSKLNINNDVVLGGTLIILPTSILDQWQLEITSLIGSSLRY